MARRLAKRGAPAAFAKKINTDPSVVSRWLSATRKPTAHFRDLIEDELGIDRRLWEKPPRKGAAA